MNVLEAHDSTFYTITNKATYTYNNRVKWKMKLASEKMVAWMVVADRITSIVLGSNPEFNTAAAFCYNNGKDSVGWHADDEPPPHPPFLRRRF